MCPNKDLDRKDKGYMPLEVFRKIVDEARTFIHEANLIHRGESLLHPDFFDMVRYAHDAGIVTKLHTNASLLDESKARALLDAGLDQLTFSFDGYDKATYESIRTNACFEKTVANILRFLEIKKELGRKKPTTILELIDFPDVYKKVGKEDRERFLAGFRGRSLDRIRVKEMHNWAGEIDGIRKGRRYGPCTFLWASLIIFWDGAVLPCTQDFFGANALGNVKDASILEIWNNDRMVRLREKILARDTADLEACSKCDRLWRRQILGIPREYLGRALLKKMN
jgi:radical SAM protein with 4Fe4S-binding SPASM domain